MDVSRCWICGLENGELGDVVIRDTSGKFERFVCMCVLGGMDVWSRAFV